MITHVTDNTFEAEVLKEEGLVLLDFWAPWCGPCKMLGPVLEDLDAELGDKVKIKKMNTDENRSTPVKYDIMGIPTMIFFKDGQAIETIVGFVGKEQIKNKILAAL